MASPQQLGVDEADLYTVDEFCRRHRMSKQAFYRRLSEMPTTFTIGTRRYITREAAARWRSEREAQATTASSA
jgi:hypothetical protein